MAAAILLLTQGALRVARPQPDDHGIDFLLYRPGARTAVSLQVKIAFAVGKGNALSFVVDLGEIPEDDEPYFLLACQSAPGFPGLGPTAWLIPGKAFKSKGAGRGPFHWWTYLVPKRPTQWDPYRLQLNELGKQIMEAVDRTAQLPRAPGRPMARGLTPLTVGKVAEDAFINQLLTGSDGRLVPFRPSADTISLDFLVRHAQGWATAGGQIKGCFLDLEATVAIAHVREETFRPSPDCYLVVVPYRPQALSLAEFLWIIRFDQLAKMAPRRNGAFEFSASLLPESRDKYTPWRYRAHEAAGVFETALALMEAKGRTAKPPASRHDLDMARRALGIRR